MFLAPICVMVFGILRGLNIFDFTLVYRSYNFIDIPLAIVVGVGVAYIFTRMSKFTIRHREFKALPLGIVVVVCILCAASLPLAYNNEKAFGIQEVTLEYEFEGLEWVSAANISAVTTDQRFGDIIGDSNAAVSNLGETLRKPVEINYFSSSSLCHALQ